MCICVFVFLNCRVYPYHLDTKYFPHVLLTLNKHSLLHIMCETDVWITNRVDSARYTVWISVSAVCSGMYI